MKGNKMKLFILFLKGLARFLFGLFAPVILIALGCLVSGWALTNEYTIFFWTGLVMVAAGVLWGVVLMCYYGPID